MERSAVFATRLHALNEQFSKWIEAQSKTSKDTLWLRGTEDYIKYAKELQSQFGDLLESNGRLPTRSEGNGEEAVGQSRPEIAVDPGAEIIFQSPASVHFQTPGEEQAWSSRGSGLLTLRKPPKDSKRPCHLVFTTEAGRVQLNAALYAGLHPRKSSNNRILLSLSLAAANGSSLETEQRVVLIRVKPDNVDRLIKSIEDNLPAQ